MAYTTINKSSGHFNTKLWTGTGSSNALTGVGFQPDWTWIKNRTDANSHVLQDAVRGVGNTIISNNTDAESAEGAGDLTAFGSDGFTVGTNGRVNGSGKNMVAWNWLAGTAVSGNTTGSGTAKAYTGSVNTTAGFSIIKYLGNGSAGHTIPHHLGVTPEIIITKRLSDAGEWYVYSPVMGNTKHMRLNRNGAEDTANTIWNNTSPTSSVFTVGTNADVNGNNNPIIAYSFNSVQGYSKFGSYIGNGNADGTFVYTGFKPAFVIYKNTTQADSWFIHDNKRQGYNPENELLFADLSNVESTVNRIDLFSNGFKATDSDKGVNASGNNYIYMAFAAAPLVGTNNVPANAR